MSTDNTTQLLQVLPGIVGRVAVLMIDCITTAIVT